MSIGFKRSADGGWESYKLPTKSSKPSKTIGNKTKPTARGARKDVEGSDDSSSRDDGNDGDEDIRDV